jgi:hypothetical protein
MANLDTDMVGDESQSVSDIRVRVTVEDEQTFTIPIADEELAAHIENEIDLDDMSRAVDGNAQILHGINFDEIVFDRCYTRDRRRPHQHQWPFGNILHLCPQLHASRHRLQDTRVASCRRVYRSANCALCTHSQ